jgi:hypothetical protein
LAKRFVLRRTLGALDDARTRKWFLSCSHTKKNNIYPMYKEGVPAEDYALEYEKAIKTVTGGWKI